MTDIGSPPRTPLESLSRLHRSVSARTRHQVHHTPGGFIAPIHFANFPSMLKGWIDRVWTLDFAFGLTSEGWHGDVNGRIPLLHHKRALIMTSTIFNQSAYDAGVRDGIGTVLDDWGFRFPGIEDVEHVYFYAATSATPELIQQYLQQAHDLGRHFDRSPSQANATTPGSSPGS